ncbi:MAG: dihydropteroate synthase [Xanthobacteraceae bacterium]
MNPLSYAAPAAELKSASLARLFSLDRPLVMGVLNVTPDSFSDSGQFFDAHAAIARANEMIAQGADIIDVGAESTRPYGGARPVSAEEELARLRPVLPAIAELGVPISIDTMKEGVAAWALGCGAAMVNDVWGLQHDRGLAHTVAQSGAPVIIMHNREAADPSIDIMADIAGFFRRSLEIAERAGIARRNMILDPGIGFGKTPQQSVTAIARLAELKEFGLPLLVGASRKRFIDRIMPAAPEHRLGGSIAAHLLAVARGASIVRVHDVLDTVQALRVAAAIEQAHE